MKNIEIPNQASERLESLEDEEILELTEEKTHQSEDDNDGILELTGIEDEFLEEDEEILDLTGLEDQSLEQDEEIIDLSDIENKPAEKSNSVPDIDLLDKTFLDLEESEDIFSKTDISDEDGGKGSLIETAAEYATSQHAPLQTNFQEGPASSADKSFSLSEEQLEEALERVIKKMFAEKIDSILVEVIEKSVAKEIERLKDILTDDAKDD